MIYGTGNRAGLTYAHYLADRGFNLVLIDRDYQPLNDIENQLREKFSENVGAGKSDWIGPIVYKVVLNKFDQ